MLAVMTRALALIPTGLLFFLLIAPAALADTQEPLSGEGLYGPADDKVVTNVGFLIIILFPLFVLCMSLLQWRLEKRKERRKAISKKLQADSRWQSGW